jgi:hypothetical protein
LAQLGNAQEDHNANCESDHQSPLQESGSHQQGPGEGSNDNYSQSSTRPASKLSQKRKASPTPERDIENNSPVKRQRTSSEDNARPTPSWANSQGNNELLPWESDIESSLAGFVEFPEAIGISHIANGDMPNAEENQWDYQTFLEEYNPLEAAVNYPEAGVDG